MQNAGFVHYTFSGSPREVGRQHGETLREHIRQHLDLIYEQGEKGSGLTQERALGLAESFIPATRQYSPDLLEEIEGVGEGAGLSLAEAMLLQTRQEVANIARYGQVELECTTFAVSGSYTKGGETYTGQNADLAGAIQEFSSVMTLAVAGKPRVLMLLPAGQISYIGINEDGLAAWGNFLRCTGWRVGFPRYLLTRRALGHRTLPDAYKAAVEPPRASSRNLLLVDRYGDKVDIETTAAVHAPIWGGDCLVHTNHYTSPDMQHHERAVGAEYSNSVCRYERMSRILEENRGRIDLDLLKTAFRDHEGGTDSICVHPHESRSYQTFASVIAIPGEARLEIAKGPPCEHDYHSYRL